LIIRAKFKDVIILPENEYETAFIKQRIKELINRPDAEFKFGFDLEQNVKDWHTSGNKEFKSKLKLIEASADV